MPSHSIIYLDHSPTAKRGWFWVETTGNRMIYTGPFKTREAAQMFCDDELKRLQREKDDGRKTR